MTYAETPLTDSMRCVGAGGQTTEALRDNRHDVLRAVRRHNIYVPAEQFAQHIENIVCARAGENYPLNDESRKQRRARARHAWAVLSRFSAQFPVSLLVMGRLLRRDHTTIISSIERGVALFARDVSFQTLVTTAENDLREDGWAVGGVSQNIAAHAATLRRKDRQRG